TIIANVRNYGITLLSGPAFGYIANKFKPSTTIAVGSGLFIAVLAVVRFLPTGTGMVVVAACLVILLGFIANGSFGVVSAQLTEGKVPLHYFGAATGLLSIIGFLPDTFSSIWFGRIMDASANAEGVVAASAFHTIFYILMISAALAAFFSIVLYVYIRRNQNKLDTVDDKGYTPEPI
ncbi:MAG: hypothetical protein LBE83_00705, partial [Propionibacteriaceae bacterium]|nr:hypothetical protein [Propionibacteriaceae bacterium]